MQTKTYVLIADGARARVFATEPGSDKLTSALDQEFVGTNLPSREIGSDRPGRSFDSAGLGRHAMEPPTDPHRYQERAFAREVAEIIEQALQRGEFARLIVVAPPKAMGDLRAEFSPEVRKRVTAEVLKDLTKVPTHELPKHLQEEI